MVTYTYGKCNYGKNIHGKNIMANETESSIDLITDRDQAVIPVPSRSGFVILRNIVVFFFPPFDQQYRPMTPTTEGRQVT